MAELKNLQQVRENFFRNGLTVSGWAREHGFKPGKVYDLLNGRCKGIRGEAHRAAVLLGLKEGIAEKRAQELKNAG